MLKSRRRPAPQQGASCPAASSPVAPSAPQQQQQQLPPNGLVIYGDGLVFGGTAYPVLANGMPMPPPMIPSIPPLMPTSTSSPPQPPKSRQQRAEKPQHKRVCRLAKMTLMSSKRANGLQPPPSQQNLQLSAQHQPPPANSGWSPCIPLAMPIWPQQLPQQQQQQQQRQSSGKAKQSKSRAALPTVQQQQQQPQQQQLMQQPFGYWPGVAQTWPNLWMQNMMPQQPQQNFQSEPMKAPPQKSKSCAALPPKASKSRGTAAARQSKSRAAVQAPPPQQQFLPYGCWPAMSSDSQPAGLVMPSLPATNAESYNYGYVPQSLPCEQNAPWQGYAMIPADINKPYSFGWSPTD